ncbi:MAG: TetR/AcrR family transcriptional regulator [bacterium]|nr:TetR/AcrR family transcriptional regulator [bacterium]
MAADKRKDILETAVSVFSEKGYRYTTIPDLAVKAGIGEATIYNHFKKKEDLLFAIPGDYLKDLISLIKENQRGIKDPVERLRKFIWQYLWWVQEHKDLAKVLIVDVQTNPNYYDSELFGYRTEISDISLQIVIDGMNKGVFRDSIDPEIFRHFIIGSMDYLFMTGVFFQRSVELLDYFDDIASLVVSAIQFEEKNELSIDDIPDKKERILLAAKNVFSSCSFSDAKISDIAKIAGVADGTIYEYFKNKEELLFSIFEMRSIEFVKDIDESLSPQSPVTKLKYLLFHILTWTQNDREWAIVFFKEAIPNYKLYLSDKHSYMRLLDERLKKIIEEGAGGGYFRDDLEIHFFRAIVFGALNYICSSWLLPEKNNSSLNKNNLVSALDDLYILVYGSIKKR